MMQEHRWQACREEPLSTWESFQNVNAGSLDEYFETHLKSTLSMPKLRAQKILEAHLNDCE
jgi:hypothetical protein